LKIQDLVLSATSVQTSTPGIRELLIPEPQLKGYFD